MRKTVLAALAGVVVPCWLAYAAQTLTVAQKNRAFAVAQLTIARGDAVRFTNEDDFPHQVHVSGPGMDVDSDLQNPGENTQVSFPDAGSFDVRCGIHPRMRLTVTVE